MSDASDAYYLQFARDTRRLLAAGSARRRARGSCGVCLSRASGSEYEVSMIVAPASQLEEKSTSSLDLGAAGNLLGIRPGVTDSRLDHYRELLTSVELGKRIDPKRRTVPSGV